MESFWNLGGILITIQVVFALVVGMYFWNLLRNQRSHKSSIESKSRRELEKLRRLRAITLTEPLAEKTRPSSLQEIVGQEDGLKALRAALCGHNPQHVIIYGPPGVGKTAAARVILEEARTNADSPFREKAKMVEMDATTARFDERGIADPLIGSVHDPIYQGSGSMGAAGIPQPKPGAVTKAHGGILFLDEIGELHPIQLNKLLKVMEDRKVMLDSAYYSMDDINIPSHIHDIFLNGLPADFRLIGATTRRPEEIAPAIRSRCLEIFFKPLTPAQIEAIAQRAAAKIPCPLTPEGLKLIAKYSANGREAVNLVQLAAGLAHTEKRNQITVADLEWVINNGRYSPRLEKKIPTQARVGLVNGLAVTGAGTGILLEIEACAVPSAQNPGRFTLTGIVEEEELGDSGRTIRRKSMAKSSLENVLTVLQKLTDFNPFAYDLHLNFTGGVPVDGPSAGAAAALALYSALSGQAVDNFLALTGEISLQGDVLPVGGVKDKIEAARLAGAKRVLIPQENYQEIMQNWTDIEIIPVKRLEQIFSLAWPNSSNAFIPSRPSQVLSAEALV